MKAEIQSAVKTAYLQYGLKAESIEKIVNTLESRLSAVGTIAPEELQSKINEQIELYRPVLALIQSEVDSRAKPKTDPPAPVNPPSPPSNDEPEWAKALRLKMEKIEQDGELQKKSQTKQTLIDDALRLAKAKGATNESLLKKAIKLASIEDGMTAEQISISALSEYNDLQSSISSDGAVPVIPALGDKATVEAAQKKGVELVDKYLGKPKTV